VYGGTFDPVHNGHLEIARAARAQAGLDKVLFVVAGQPPHRGRGARASAEDRYAMVAEAVADEPGMEPCRLELDRPGPSYTVDTLAALQEQYPGAALFLILGLDAAADFPKWRNTAGILSRARLLVVPRPGRYDIPDWLQPHCTLLRFAPVDLSSTEIRDRLTAGETPDGVLPLRVLHLIHERGIYRP